MHLVNADRILRPVLPTAGFHPCAVVPDVTLQIVHHGRGRFTVLIEKRERIALEQYRAGLCADFELVVSALLNDGQTQFPHSAPDEFAHRIHPAIPVVEVTDHAHALRVGRPHCEINAHRITDCAQMGAELFVNLPVLSFRVEMQIDLAHDWPVLVGIARELLQSIPGSHTETVWKIPRRPRPGRTKETVLVNSLRRDRLLRMTIQHNLDRARVRAEYPDLQIITHAVRTQDTERIRMRACDEGFYFVGAQS